MKKPTTLPLAKTAIITLSEIKAAIEEFDRGDANVHDVLDTVVVAVEGYRAALSGRPKRSRPPRKAA